MYKCQRSERSIYIINLTIMEHAEDPLACLPRYPGGFLYVKKEMAKKWTYTEWKKLFEKELPDTHMLTLWLASKVRTFDKWELSLKVLPYLSQYYEEKGDKNTRNRIDKLIFAREHWRQLKNEKNGLLKLRRTDTHIQEEEDPEEVPHDTP